MIHIKPPALNKREKRRLAYLLSAFAPCEKSTLEMHAKEYGNIDPGIPELLRLVNKTEVPDAAFMEYWRRVWTYRIFLKAPYKPHYNRPNRPKKDNAGELVGSGGSNRSKIRFPKKVRKTAWKRFYKLFPNLKPK